MQQNQFGMKYFSGANEDPNGPQPEYVLKDFHVPLFDNLVKRQGYSFVLQGFYFTLFKFSLERLKYNMK